MGRFRSKEDLYKYLVNKVSILCIMEFHVVGLFLPSMNGTTLAFIRAILKDEKKVLN
jgi:hypothetical protein